MGTSLVKFTKGTVSDVRLVARGWRWGRHIRPWWTGFAKWCGNGR